MNDQTNQFCSDLSINACEPLYGTASIGQVWLLLEHPQNWGEKALDTSQFPADVKAYLHAVLKKLEGGRLLLIRQGRSQPETLNFFLAVTRESSPHIQHFKLETYEDLLGMDIPRLARMADGAPDNYEEHPLYLTCTDGKHDKCCAKYGLRVYQTLKATFGERVWETSHVGGDRFAANMVCFPHGLYFGRVSEAEAERIAGDYRNGRIYLSNYRGRCCYSQNAQIGEHFIRSQSGDTRLDSLRFLGDEAPEEDQSLVRFSSADDQIVHTVRFRSSLSDFEIPSSCRSDEKRKVTQHHLLEYTSFDRAAFLSPGQAEAVAV
jgi:hypothetical protein